MSLPGRRLSLGSGLVLVVLWGGACSSIREPEPLPQHYFDKTEVDLEYGRSEAAARYQRPRGVQQYLFDDTEIDLARPRDIPPQEEQPGRAPAASGSAPSALLPGGDR